MERKHWFIIAALTAAALALYGRVAGRSISKSAAPELRYATSCAFAESNSVDGFVTNQSSDLYAVRGEARFVFTRENSISRPEVLIQANSLVPAGETVRVGRARLTDQLHPDETCRFDVAAAIRRQ